MEEIVKIENKLLAKLGTELMDDIQVTLINVRDKSMLVSSIRAKWVMKFFREKEQLKKLKQAKEALIQQGTDSLQTTDISARTMSKLRLNEKVMENNPKFKKLNILLDQQSEVIQFMEYALNIVSDFNFTVKHVLDALKLEQA